MTASTAVTTAAEPGEDGVARHYRMFIGGQWVDAPGRFTIHDPATEEVVATVARGEEADLDRAVAAAKQAHEEGVWRNTSPEDRARLLEKVGGILAERAANLAELQTRENGATIRLSSAFHIGLPIVQLQYMADLARAYQWQEEAPEADGAFTGTFRREPIGVCAAIVPWNIPLQLAVNKVGPALAAGNTVVIKPDENAPLLILEFAAALAEAGLPAGVFNVVTGVGEVVGAQLAAHPDVRKIAFTGSTAVGREVMARGSQNVKRVTLELGGKGPNIVLEDADLSRAVDGALFAFLAYSGQACESGTRLLLPESIHDEFVKRMIERISVLRIGSPMDPESDMGPVFSKVQFERIMALIQSGIEEGATIATGGKHLTGPGYEKGYWVEPTIFTNVRNDMRIAREEIFGPVVSVIKYRTVDEAVEIANDTQYGLSCGIWSEDRERAMEVASRIDTGMVWINDFHVLDCRYPFGGVKQSGLGRELGPDALDEYTEVKHITYATGRKTDEHPFALLFGTK